MFTRNDKFASDIYDKLGTPPSALARVGKAVLWMALACLATYGAGVLAHWVTALFMAGWRHAPL